ncbi:hypothetical protein K470DRAFT_206527, partial [Piedraia hortae CBS 480.64]
SVDNPPTLHILPRGRSATACIVTLPDPITPTKAAQYFVDPILGFYEFTQTSSPKNVPKSWLLVDDNQGYTLQSPSLVIATPIDPLFLLLPALWTGAIDNTFAPLHDRLFFSDSDTRYAHLRPLLGPELESQLESRLSTICNSQAVGDEVYYNLSLDKLASVLLFKTQNLNLPPSLHKKLVDEPLEVPGIESAIVSEDIKALLRTRAALGYILRNYITESLRPHLWTLFAKAIDFAPLDAHLQHVEKLRAEALARQSLTDNLSRKRGGLGDEEAMDRAETKKRKKEEEEKNKKNASLGVKRLMKADTTGMKKLSSFFKSA